MTSLPNTTTAAFTHLLALITGIVIGKSIDADELNAYRSSSSYADDLWTRIRRQMKSMIVGGIVLGLLVKTGSAAMKSLLGSSGNDGVGTDDETKYIIGGDGDGNGNGDAMMTPAGSRRWR